MDVDKNYAWVNDVDYMKHLDNDSKLIVQELGIETYLKLFFIFNKTRIYFSKKFYYANCKEFIRKNADKYSIRHFSIMLNVSEEFIRRAIKEGSN